MEFPQTSDIIIMLWVYNPPWQKLAICILLRRLIEWLKRDQTFRLAEPKEQETELLKTIDEIKHQKGALMPILQKAQEIYGYLPIEVQKIVAEGLDITVEEVYGVVTFYSQFTLSPKGRYNISVCLGTACYVKGANAIYEKFSDLLKIKGGECTNDGKFFAWSLPVHRGLRTCSGIDNKRGRLRPHKRKRSWRNPRKICG